MLIRSRKISNFAMGKIYNTNQTSAFFTESAVNTVGIKLFMYAFMIQRNSNTLSLLHLQIVQISPVYYV